MSIILHPSITSQNCFFTYAFNVLFSICFFDKQVQKHIFVQAFGGIVMVPQLQEPQGINRNTLEQSTIFVSKT